MPTNGLYLLQRKAGEDEVIIVLNGLDSENEVDMARYLEIIPAGKRYRDVITGEELELIPSSGKRFFAPRETRILIPAE